MRGARRAIVYVVQVAVAGLALAAAAVVLVPKALGWDGMMVLTGSMEPALQAGGVAFVDPVPAERVRVGDVVTFTRANSRQQLTHRVISVVTESDGPHFRTKGDANEAADSWTVAPGQVVGKVRYGLPAFGGVTGMLVTHRPMVGGVMALAAIALVVDDVRRSRRRRRPRPRRHRPVPVLFPTGTVVRPLRAS
jgi:signal peptidase